LQEEKPAEKTEFTVKLDKVTPIFGVSIMLTIQVDAAVKAKVIREIKGILPGANLVEVICCQIGAC
jgi:large subunit ribosomal protein L7/L12